MERSEGVTALRRRFLTDLAWPVQTDLLCHMFGLIDASQEVRDLEQTESEQRMRRLAEDEVASIMVSAARDAAQVMNHIEDPDERTAWLATYAMAVVNLLEAVGKIEVVA